jgi:tRNA(Arg) A34 adenosine deaminase TadA
LFHTTPYSKYSLVATKNNISRLLSCIEDEILPLTILGVQNGNKVFGAAILQDDGADWPLVVARTNDETTSTLLHGEVNCLLAYSSSVNSTTACPRPGECIFLSTHEPCCMCISSIVWSGFNRVYYFFGYEETKNQGIPHDINIMHELWGVPTYRRRNKFLSSASIIELVNALPNDDSDKETFQQRIDNLLKVYDTLANQYHSKKPENSTIIFD